MGAAHGAASRAPSVSVIVPIYNRPDFLQQIVGTLQQQRFPDWEAIIVDDGSSLDIAGAIAPFLSDSRIRFLRLDRNAGAAAARNHGVAAARGRYVAFLDSDDLWHADKLGKQIALLDAQPFGEAVFCITLTMVIMPGGWERVRPDFAPRPGQSFADYLYRDGGFAQASSLMLPRDLALATPFHDGLRQYEDHLLFIELHAKGARYLVIPEALTIWRNDDRADRLGRRDDLARGANFLAQAGPLLTPGRAGGLSPSHGRGADLSPKSPCGGPTRPAGSAATRLGATSIDNVAGTAGCTCSDMERSARGGRVKKKLVLLQIMRAVAASAVVIDHAMAVIVARGLAGPAVEQLGWFIGWLGVATFFTISGLIMIRTSFGEFGVPGASWHFVRRRVFRVIPLYWAVTLLYFALKWAAGDHLGPGSLVQSLAFIPYRVPDAIVMRPIVGQGWTLNLEMAFYAIFALSLARTRRVGLAFLIGILLALVAVGVIGRAWSSQPYADPVTLIQFWTDPIILFFLAGIVIGLAEQKGLLTIAMRWPVTVSVGLLALATIAFLGGGIVFPLSLPVQLCLGIFPVLAVLVCTADRGDALGTARQIGMTVGDASYSTYLLHPLVLLALGAVYWRSVGPLCPPVLFIAIAVLAANIAGWFCYRLIERPLGKAVSTHSGRRARQPLLTADIRHGSRKRINR